MDKRRGDRTNAVENESGTKGPEDAETSGSSANSKAYQRYLHV